MLYLLGISADRLAVDPQIAGPLLESFVAMEIRKQITWSRSRGAPRFRISAISGPRRDTRWISG
jgi:hypothetical protein